MKKILVWSIYTRVFHVLAMVMMLGAYLSSGEDKWLSIHASFGYAMGALFLGRVLWGFLDIPYSKFKDFNFNFAELKSYALNVFGNKKQYLGHNPASSYAIIGMMVLLLLSIISGALAYGVQEGMGIASFLNHTVFAKMKIFKEVHEFFSNALVFLIAAHIAGALLDRLLHSKLILRSMVDGYKEGEGKSIQLSLVQKAFGIVWLGLAMFALVYLLASPKSVLLADNNPRVDYATLHPAFAKECGSCHMLYPPHLLPKASWDSMMSSLENHFGDDASLDAKTTQSIKTFLDENSAEHSTKEAAVYMLARLKNGTMPESITQTKFWKKRHQGIEKVALNDPKIGKISNCKACHPYIEQGSINDRDIKG